MQQAFDTHFNPDQRKRFRELCIQCRQSLTAQQSGAGGGGGGGGGGDFGGGGGGDFGGGGGGDFGGGGGDF